MDEQLLIQFLTHTCTSEDLRLVDQWIASGKPNADWLFEMQRIWSLKDELRFSDRREIEEAYNRFTLSLGKSKNAKPHFYIYPILKYVAAVIIIGLLGLNLYKMVQPATVGENTVEVPKGQRASLMLSDGTKIWLNSQSKLIYPTQFSDKERNVRLEGEAFFDVAHKEHLPFVVHSPLLAIKVLGTKFNVSSYPEDISAKTTLLEGSIDILYKGRHIPVAPGELLSLDKQNGSFSRQKVQASQYKSWTEGRVEYDKITLNELAVRLSRKYDVQIHLGDDLEKDIAFRVSLRNEETVGDVFHALSEIIPIRYERRDRDIYIRKQ